MIIGISFLESWVKFKAPSLTRAVGLEVGSIVFRYFHYVQTTCLIVLLGLNFVHPIPNTQLALAGLTAIYLLQTFWVFPQLQQRARQIIREQTTLPHSHAHSVYGVLEIIKWLILVSFGVLVCAN